MKQFTVVTGLLAVASACLIASAVHAQQKPRKLQGIEPYTPTKLEWLAVELNAEAREELTAETGFSLAYTFLEKDDAILVRLRHMPDVRRELINTAVDGARHLIELKAKNRGWDWVVIKEKVEQIDMGTTAPGSQRTTDREPPR